MREKLSLSINSIFYKANKRKYGHNPFVIGSKKLMGSQKNREFLNFNIIVTNNPPSLKKKKKKKETGRNVEKSICLQGPEPATKDGERQITKDRCQKYHESIKLLERRIVHS